MGEAIRPVPSGGLGPPSRRPKAVSLWIVPVVGVACIVGFVLSANLRESVPGTTLQEVPPEAVGRWVTADARYADRGLRISPRQVVLELGADGPPMRGDILVVSIRDEGQSPVVYIEYDAGEGPVVMEVILDGPDRMHLRNPSDVTWTRVR